MFYMLSGLNGDFLSNKSRFKTNVANIKLSQMIVRPTRVTADYAILLCVIITYQTQSLYQIFFLVK